MCATTEFEIKVSEGKIILPKNLPDGVYKLVVEAQTTTINSSSLSQQYQGLVRVPVSELSLDEDWFKKHQPKTEAEKKFKEQVKTAIERGLKDFYRPKYDPAFKKAGGICYMSGRKPAVGKSYNWWVKTANDFKPECKSRLGTKTEYIAFLAVLIKKLVASGWQVQDAWYAVCNDSKELGHYWNSKNAKHAFEETGCREICGFYDLANTYKILAEDEENGGFWLAGGNCINYSANNPLAELYHSDCSDHVYDNGIGWIVLTDS